MRDNNPLDSDFGTLIERVNGCEAEIGGPNCKLCARDSPRMRGAYFMATAVGPACKHNYAMLR
jgi:hypothetical protein